MYLVTQHMFDNVANVPNKLQFVRQQAWSFHNIAVRQIRPQGSSIFPIGNLPEEKMLENRNFSIVATF